MNNQITGQVMTLRKQPNCFTLRTDKVVDEDFYVFVYLNKLIQSPDYFVLGSSEILSNIHHFMAQV
jgi:hypothetical protein